MCPIPKNRDKLCLCGYFSLVYNHSPVCQIWIVMDVSITYVIWRIKNGFIFNQLKRIQ